jgi:uncharacterized membrane protein
MNRFLVQLVIQTTLGRKTKEEKGQRYSELELTKGLSNLKISVIQNIKDFALISLGIFSAAFGFKGFLLSNHFIDGGVTGISLLISALTPIPLYLLILLINIHLLFLHIRLLVKHLPKKQQLQ